MKQPDTEKINDLYKMRLDNLMDHPEHLEQLLGKLTFLLEHHSISISDDNGILHYANKKFFEMNGFSPKEIIGTFYKTVDPRTEFWRELVERLTRNESWRGEIQSLHKNGQTFWTDALIIPLPLLKGPPGYLSISTDITRLKSIVEKLSWEIDQKQGQLDSLYTTVNASRKMLSLGTMASNIAHEINNPLSSVSSNLQSLEKMLALLHNGFIYGHDGRADKIMNELPEMIAEMQEELRRALKITRDLKSYCLDEDNHQEYLDINQCMVNAFRIISSTAHHEIQFDTDLGILPKIQGNAVRITQVFVNLLTNACQAIGNHHGVIWITSKHLDSSQTILIAIRDNGCGIAPEYMPRIFDPFFTTRQTGEGVGLGLTVSADIIEAHGGKIECFSQSGAGAEFAIKLPIVRDNLPTETNTGQVSLPFSYAI